jgi:patatin-like phospholipase/acyl hydrolase
MHLERRKLNILSLDSGGIRGLSSLYVLKQMMETIDPHRPPKPCEVFDIIGGVGSGGHVGL